MKKDFITNRSNVTKIKSTRTTRAPAFWECPPPPHDYPYFWFIPDPKSKQDKVKVTNLKIPQIFKFWNFAKKHCMRHTFWSCLIRCVNMKWIWLVLWKLQSGHDSIHRWTDRLMDGQTDGRLETSTPPFQLRWSTGYKNKTSWISARCYIAQITPTISTIFSLVCTPWLGSDLKVL